MKEPSVVLTDFALAAQCAIFAWRLAPGAGSLLFAALGAGAFFGGLHHAGLEGVLPWRLSLVGLGVGAFACWSLGVRRALPAAHPELRAAGGLGLAAYLPFVLVADRGFLVPTLALAAGSISLLAGFAARGEGWGAAGILLSLGGAALQQLRVGLGTHFDHNALYHVIQMVALAPVYRALATREMRDDPC